ncbi:MAG: response regulator [Pseudomonadota bacterium]
MSTILIVDDKMEVRLSLRAILEDDGHTIHEAENGNQAIQTVQSDDQKFDMIITDIMMPEVDGIEFMTALKIMNSQAPVLAISGGGYSMDAHEMLGAASNVADHILTKPFTPGELHEAVKVANQNKGTQL